MHLVFINQYYPPDAAPTGIALAAVAEELALQGHSVTVICAKGGYAEMQHPHMNETTNSNLTIKRIWASRFGRGTFIGKLLDYLFYFLCVTFRLALLWPKPQRIIALTTPPYLSVLARVMSNLRGADHAHWVMDLYPDVMVAHGILQQDSLLHRLLAWLARWGMAGKRCAAILTLGPDMAEKLIDNRAEVRGKNARQLVSWVPLWSARNETTDDLAIAQRRHEMGWRDNELVVMYSGNMGLGHRFKEILEIAKQESKPCKDEDSQHIQNLTSIRFVFFGGGKRRSEIAEFIEKYPNALVELHDYVPEEILSTHLQSADIHLASLDTKWTGTMLPSKLQGIFAVSRPVIFIGDENSGIGRWVRQSGGGWIVAPGDTGGLRDAIYQAQNRKDRESRGRAAKAYAEVNFSRQINIRRVVDILVC